MRPRSCRSEAFSRFANRLALPVERAPHQVIHRLELTACGQGVDRLRTTVRTTERPTMGLPTKLERTTGRPCRGVPDPTPSRRPATQASGTGLDLGCGPNSQMRIHFESVFERRRVEALDREIEALGGRLRGSTAATREAQGPTGPEILEARRSRGCYSSMGPRLEIRIV